jgi:hypothetical protein
MAKHNRTGRSKSGARFIMLHEYIVRSYAWGRLSPLARCAWIEVQFLHNGSNNGRICISARLLAERLGCGKTAAADAILDLMRWGFLDRVKASDFGKKKECAEYRITTERCNVTGAAASKRFMRIGADDAVVVPMRQAAEAWQ